MNNTRKQSKAWYSSARWQRRRAHHLAREPLCAFCLKRGHVTAATVADHIIPHRECHELFWYGDLQSLCAPCHSSTKQQIETSGYSREIGIDGWPVDPNHPANKGRT